MPHDIGPAPKHTYKKGDRVQHIGCGLFATVVEDQTDPLIITINWDERPEGPQDYRADAFAVAPWHSINFKEYGGAVKAVPKEPTYHDGDRVKLKHKRVCGTVKGYHVDGNVMVVWDKNKAGTPVPCPEKDLVTLYAPRDTDPVNPNQEAIDAIEVQRQVLIKEVEAVQARLRSLTMAKRLLERG